MKRMRVIKYTTTMADDGEVVACVEYLRRRINVKLSAGPVDWLTLRRIGSSLVVVAVNDRLGHIGADLFDLDTVDGHGFAVRTANIFAQSREEVLELGRGDLFEKHDGKVARELLDLLEQLSRSS